MNDINFECGNWTFKSPEIQKLDDDERSSWKLSIKNTGRNFSFNLFKPKQFQIEDLDISP